MNIQIEETPDKQKLIFHLFHKTAPLIRREPIEYYKIEIKGLSLPDKTPGYLIYLFTLFSEVEGVEKVDSISNRKDGLVILIKNEDADWDEMIPDIFHIIKSVMKNKEEGFIELPRITC